MLARRFLRVLQRGVVGGLLRLRRGPRIVQRLLRDQRALEELAGALECLRRLDEVGLGPLDLGRLLDVGQVFGIGGAVLRERPRQRRLLLLVGVALLLVVELDEHLAGRDPVAEVGEDARTLPSASDETVTWSTAASVPTTSTARGTESCRTASTLIGLAFSELRACAVSVFEQPAAARTRAATRAIRAGRLTLRM